VKKFNALTEKDVKNDPLHRWLTFFDLNTPENVLKEVMDMDMAIRKASDKITYLQSDKEVLCEYHMREMALSDYNSGMKKAEAEGMAKGEVVGIAKGEAIGIAKGKAEEKAAIAKSMLLNGFASEVIATITGLSPEQIGLL
jgi:predicted transposase/invertase (TIGR01784 family)